MTTATETTAAPRMDGSGKLALCRKLVKHRPRDASDYCNLPDKHPGPCPVILTREEALEVAFKNARTNAEKMKAGALNIDQYTQLLMEDAVKVEQARR